MQRILVTLTAIFGGMGAVSGLLLIGLAVASAEPLPVDHFTRFDEFGAVKISPDGAYLAVTSGRYGRSTLAFINLNDRKIGNAASTPDNFEIIDFEWVSPTRVIYSLAERLPGYKRPVATGEIYAIDRDGKRQALIHGAGTGAGAFVARRGSEGGATVISTLPADNDNILIAEYSSQEEEPRPRIAKLDVYTGSKRNLGKAPLAFANIVVDSQQQIRFAFGYNEASELAAVWKPQPGAEWQAFNVPGFQAQTVKPLSFTADDKSVLFTAVRKGESLQALYSVELVSNTIQKLYQHARADVDRVVNSLAGDGTAVGVQVVADKLEYHWLAADNPTAGVYQRLQTAFKDQAVRITSATADGGRTIVFVSSDVNPGQYFLFDTRTNKAEMLLATRGWIRPKEMRPKEPISIKASDGLTLHGYLTRPMGTAPFPLIVLPHGGPHGVRDDWEFDPEVQLLASRGYAVLQVNFRGSGGYGMNFQVAGYRQWGARMQDDLTDATRWALNNGVAREQGVCIYGASYGGYAALMGVVREPTLYNCAVGYVGVYDLELLFTSGDIPDSRFRRKYLDLVLGKDTKSLRERSPAYNATRIQVPIMLIHGKEDQRADFAQAKRMRKALEDTGKPPVWLALSGEGHGAYDEANRRNVYEKLLAFLQQHLPGEPTQPSANTAGAESAKP